MSIPDGLKTTPFHFAYPADLETEWIEVMEHGVPLWVTDPEGEYAAFRTRVGLLEYSMLYRWDLRGPGAVATADAVFSRSVAGMRPGTMAYGVVVDEDGRMVDDPTAARYDDEHVLLVGGNPAVGELLEAHRAEGTTIAQVRERFCVLSIQGPRSRELLQRLTATDLSNETFPYYTFKTGIDIAGITCQVNRIGFTAELGYEVVAPIERAEELLDAAQQAGADLGAQVCGAAALMMCRIESGMVMAGLEYDETSTPFECRLGWAVDLDKGSFLGREALLRSKESAPTRVVTLRVDGDPDGLDGQSIERDGAVIGVVTMAVPSPQLDGATLAMARLARSAAEVGTELSVAAADGLRAAHVVRTPVYDPERTRVRS